MSFPADQLRRVAVIGGGISGLAAAHRLVQLEPDLSVVLLEASDRLGGVLRTESRDGYLLEHSADNFITTSPWAVDLCRQIGLADHLLPTDASHRKAFVVDRGRLVPVPEGFALMTPRRLTPVLTTPLLSLRGKLRLLAECLIPRRKAAGDESLASFVRRRLGREAYERLVQPLVGGIYTADGEKLSVQAALPRFVEMERRHGSLLRAVRHEMRRNSPSATDESGARYSMFLAPEAGMTSLVEALAAQLPAGTVSANHPVERIQRAEDKWHVYRAGEAVGQQFDGVVIATPAGSAGKLLRGVDQELAALLEKIPYAGCAIVLVGLRREQVSHPLDGFGFVVPEVAGRKILAGSFSSVKFPGRAPADRVLIRVFIGGARHPELVELDDLALTELALVELTELLGVRGAPDLIQVVRWRGVMPQYHLGHNDLVQQIETRVAQQDGLELAGNAYHGVGIPDCIHSGQQAAGRILERLKVES